MTQAEHPQTVEGRPPTDTCSCACGCAMWIDPADPTNPCVECESGNHFDGVGEDDR